MSEIKIELKEQAKELYERLLGIVRCKDCEYYEHTQYGAFCNNVYGLHEDTDGDDYCSYGERKEQEDG